MGFSLLDEDEPALFPDVEHLEAGDIRTAPDDEVMGREIEGDDANPGGADVPLEGRLVFSPSPTDMVLVNGVELTPQSTLQSLKTACSFHGLSTSGSKVKCFSRLLNHQKEQELEIIHAATEQYQVDEARRPKAVDLQEPPSEKEQQLHNLSHLPYAPWCPSCVCFRARADKQQRSDGARSAGVATVSFDFCYTKSVPETMKEKDVDTMTCLVMCDSTTGYLHAVPLRSKNQWSLMVRELLGFAGILGHSELVYRCDNEPTLLQLQRMVVNARLSMGLPTRKTNPPPYSHGNSLVENAVGRIRPLAGTLMHYLSEQVGIEFSTNSPLWSWAFRHACFLLNRFNPTRGATAFELLYNKAYGGKICNFGEPVFGYATVTPTTGKGTAKWRRMIFLGKSDPQDIYVLFDGHGLVLTRSIRRISTVWRGHLPFYMNFRCWSWEYKTGFGGRIVPTKEQKGALSASFNGPVGEIEPSAFFDEEAEAVKQKHLEEVREEAEGAEMSLHDKQPEVPVQAVADGPSQPEPPMQFPNPTNIWDEDPSGEVQPVNMDASAVTSSSAGPGADVPRTPDVFAVAPSTPRQSPTTRQHVVDVDDEEGQEAKRARVESSKKQRLERISAEYSSMVRAVQFADETFHTMDEYEHDLQMDDHDNVEAWIEEEKDFISLDGIPDELWSDAPIDHCPPSPDPSIDRIADRVELSRLCNMGVLVEGNMDNIDVSQSLTSKFVYDWRLKDRKQPDGTTCKCWLRRSRLVAREYAFWEKRNDTYAPATSTHILNLLPMMYLQGLTDVADENFNHDDSLCLGTLDVKDAFLMVDQPSPMLVTLLGQTFTVRRNLPGQRLGAKSWYWFLREFLSSEMDFEWCKEQPCLARNASCCIMVHVDDILFCGNRRYWQKTFLTKLAAKFKISHSELGGIGSEISFLKRRIKRVQSGLALLPGTSAEKVIAMFENHFGKVRAQTIPCDGGIHTEDLSAELPPDQAFAYRSVVGTCLYLARDRPDLLFTVKELSGGMSKPTYTCLQRLKKLVGYLKSTADFCVLLDVPIGGQGRWRSSDKFLVLESFSDSDWSSNQVHRRSTSSGVHMLNGAFLFGSSRTQRVVSLSSCESELHAMISTLSDGIFLRRCIEFVFKTQVTHVMFTDSSSGRQLAMRQGTGKVKHLSGKVLWIQDCVKNGDVELSQISTVWNVSDIATKALGSQRMQLLLHELGMASNSGGDRYIVVGEAEYQTQSQRHGLPKLVRKIAQAMFLLGLEPQHVGAEMVLDEHGSCPNVNPPTGGDSLSFMAKFFLIMAVVIFLVFCWRVYKKASDAYESFEQNYTDLAVLESVVTQQGHQIRELRERLEARDDSSRRLREGIDELQAEVEMVSDAGEGLHYGLIQLGGFTPSRNLTSDDRRQMYELERANLVARRVMGSERFMSTVRQQNRGQGYGEDTDMPEGTDGAASTGDNPPNQSNNPENLTTALQTLRNEINGCLHVHEYHVAAQIQQLVLRLLDGLHGEMPMPRDARVELFNSLGDDMEGLANQLRIRQPQIASRFDYYSGQLREMATGR